MQYAMFHVDTTPFCIWDDDPRRTNQSFIASVNEDFFTYQAEVHRLHLDGDQKAEAALSLRLAYYHSLESFLAFLYATLQAPEVTFGWILKYRTATLKNLARKISLGIRFPGRDSTAAWPLPV